MNTRSTQPPWEFLLCASRSSLQSFELSRLAHAANLRKEIVALIDQWIDENATAMLARLLIQQREGSPGTPDLLSEGESRNHGAHSVSDNLLSDRAVAQTINRGPS
jgi:hypothetical protein